MIKSKLPELKLKWEREHGRRLTYEMLTEATGLSGSTLARMFSLRPIARIDGPTISALCKFFGVGVGDVLEYVDLEPIAKILWAEGEATQ